MLYSVNKKEMATKIILCLQDVRSSFSIYLILCVQVDLSCTLHGAKEVTELLIYLFYQLLQRVQPAFLSLQHI